ncbi:MAG TPA: hypothetical protein VGE52_01810 [Pirellulales bacterium]
MTIPIRVKLVMERPPELTIREWRTATKASTAEMGRRWHSKYARLHFTPQAEKRYGYKPRTTRYKRNKRKLAERGKVQSGGVVPLVFSGLLREALLTHATIRSFPTRATVVMTVPRYVKQRPQGNRPYLAAEATMVIEEEAAELSDFLERRVVERVNQVRASKQIQVG